MQNLPRTGSFPLGKRSFIARTVASIAAQWFCFVSSKAWLRRQRVETIIIQVRKYNSKNCFRFRNRVGHCLALWNRQISQIVTANLATKPFCWLPNSIWAVCLWGQVTWICWPVSSTCRIKSWKPSLSWWSFRPLDVYRIRVLSKVNLGEINNKIIFNPWCLWPCSASSGHDGNREQAIMQLFYYAGGVICPSLFVSCSFLLLTRWAQLN